MQVQTGVFEPKPGPSRVAPDSPTSGPNGSPVQGSRALVPVQPIDSSIRRRDARYPSAAFLAHLIAVDRRAPQTRSRGRAAPADAAAVYGAALEGASARTGCRLCRSA
jgi:hypothetical protein